MSIAKNVVGRPVLVAIVFSLIMITSLYLVSGIALDLMPNTERPVLSVSASYSGASPESVEKSLTAKLESALINVSGLQTLTSTSSEGSSRLTLEFGYEVNLDNATNDIRDKLDSIRNSLPDGAGSPRIFKFNADDMPIIRIAVSGKRTAEDLKVLAEQYIQPYLEQVDGIAQADVNGGRARIVRVELSQNRLDAYGLTITGVSTGLASQNVELGGGSIGEGTKDYLIRTTGEYRSVAEIADTVVATIDGYGVRLSDLGRVFEGYADESSVVYVNGEPGVYVSLSKRSGTNTVKAADGVYAKMKEIQRLLPDDVSMEIVSDMTDQIRGTINNLLASAWQGALLAMMILFLFLRTVKSTVIIGISIPFSILVTLLAMYFAGITLNMMTMTGLILGVGMIVDASIVILENIYQYRERGANPKVAAVLGSQEMMSAIISSNLTTIFVFIPVLFFKHKLGMLGQLFTDMIFTIVIALLSSLFVAIFLIPVLASTYLPLSTRKEKPLRNRVLIFLDTKIEGAIEGLNKAYRKALAAAIHHRPTTVLIVLGTFLVSLTLIPKMNINLLPTSSDDSITLNVSLPIGTKLDVTKAVMLELENAALTEALGVKDVITTVGRGQSSYTGQLAIQLPAFAERIDDAETIKAKLRAHFGDFPNATFNFSLGRFRQMGGGSDIDIAIRTQDLTAGIAMAHTVVDLLNDSVHDVKDVAMSLKEGLPQVEVVIDRQRVYSFGVTVSAVAKEIYASVAGATATTYRSNGDENSVILFLQESDRMKVPDLERIYVKGTSGRVAVANFARLEKGVGPVSITRENQNRVIHITAGIATDRRPGDVEADIQALIADTMVIPEGISLAYEGTWNNIVETGNVFIMIVTMALLLVFGVMAGQYESFRDPLINMFTIPLLVIGVVAVYAITRQPLTMFTAIGVVMLVGIVVNNGIVLVDYTNLLVARGMPVREACIQGGASRLRPVLMTTLTTILGLMPMAFSGGENSQMIQPIGLTVLGGLSSSTLITLFFIPVMYSFFNEKRGKKIMEAAK
ncbi:MAG: AcrB/AcrD/AcrF family protein [Spirochaetae bacterium HGW-Spirochaetae-7]|jgi:HAE1 family hydrophobic/amphiphilic exporter-1|nr:MAG: AcrB/AcrD/AcrF family protein [Spirochaetae bacterium HGW-Spirochaetae-7]